MSRTISIYLSLFALAFGLFPPASAQKFNPRDDIGMMVETERSFSQMSEQAGTRAAFATFIADEGILFRPHAVVGKKWMQEHPLPPSQTRPLLTWEPIFAAISSSGDLGYTTGPWQYKNDIKDAKPSAFGNFMTIWKKQANGKWRFVLDLGISNPEPGSQTEPAFSPHALTGQFAAVDVAASRTDLLNEERALSKASNERGAAEAFPLKADVDVRVFREGAMPFVGRDAAARAMYPSSTVWTWTPAFADVSQAGDLGYSYGAYELRDKKTGAISESGNYARVWKKVGGRWRVVIDVANPVKDN
jgi:ketosteroid isomerase-like protein